MKATDVVQAFERFFLDILGFVIPGTLFLLLMRPWVPGLYDSMPVTIPPQDSHGWIFLLMAGYIAGFVVQSFGGKFVMRPLEYLKTKKFLSWLLPIEPYQVLKDRIESSLTFKLAKQRLAKHLNLNQIEGLSDFREVRNLIMSIIPEQNPQIYRFRFLSEMCGGTATVFLLTGLLTLLNLCWSWRVNGTNPFLDISNRNVAFFLFAGWLLLERRYRFYGISMRIPFSIAFAIVEKEPSIATEEVQSTVQAARSGDVIQATKIYLSGGMHSGWQDEVMQRCKGLSFMDPRTHGLSDARQYTAWDLEAIKQCDIVFAYMDPQNPSGFGLALEVGFAKALSKTVIFVDEKSQEDELFERYAKIVHYTADVVFASLGEGIAFLRSFQTELPSRS